MRKKTRYRVNPYLFLLLKRMLDYEFVGLGQRPTDRDLGAAISLRSSHLRATLLMRGELITGTKNYKSLDIGEIIRKELLGKKNFDFSPKMLDRLAREISVIDSFNSWEEFLNKYKDDKGARTCQRKFMDRDFMDIGLDDQQNIFGWVENRLSDLHFKVSREDKKNKPYIIRNTNDFIIRSPNKREITQEFRLPNRLQEYAINWFEENKQHIYIYKDNYGISGHLILLALNKDTRRLLLDHYISYPFIPNSDLQPHRERLETKHIHIIDFFCLSNRIRKIFLKDFEKMLRSLSSVPDHELMLSIAKQPGVPSVWDKYDFKYAGQVIDISTGLQSPYYDITWKNLKAQLTYIQ